MDLGTVNVNLRATLVAGDQAPPFEVDTVDGTKVALADLRGKVALLDFWATWCGPCVKKLPELEKLHQEFSPGGEFEIVALSLDHEKETVQKFLEGRTLPWKQGLVGDWTTSELATTYSISLIPATFLIGRDGKVIGRDLQGPTLREAIQTALKNP